MANYTFDLALVKYYEEHLDEYATYMPFKISNTKDKPFYAKISIVNQGNLTWSFVDGSGNAVTEKTYTLNANSVLSLNEKLVASTTPTETQKDSISIRIEYFKNSDLTGKFGEDTITAPIHIFIQNSDHSWTSTQYANESDIVFDTFDFTGVDLSMGPATQDVLAGVNGKAVMRWFWRHGSSGKLWVVEDTPLLGSTARLWPSYYIQGYLAIVDAVTKLKLDKFIAMVFNCISREGGGYSYGYGTISDPNRTGIIGQVNILISDTIATYKIVSYPSGSDNTLPILHVYPTSSGTPIIQLASVYVFNKLP